ncbi:MAG: glycosyltransferase family 39 protein [Lachnospiraceae bacterium]|nr:glycosyltransferase family 39 protein [Lachnospiraceae bacterium]
MRIIDYFNLAAAVIYLAVVFLFLIKKPSVLQTSGLFRKSSGSALLGRQASGFFQNTSGSLLSVRQASASLLSDRQEKIIFCLFLGLGIFLRFFRLADMPEGFQQDEASNAYEAFALSYYGMDRNGYHWPIYPITWGSGGGSPFLIYLCALVIRIFGNSVLTFRSVIAFFGICTLILFYLYIKKVHNSTAALIGLGALAVCPWHVILSRWILDCNTIPFWVILVLLLFWKASITGKTLHYLITAAVSGLCLYCYGSATVVIPLFLLLACCYNIYVGRLSIKQLLLSGLSFLLVVAPLAVFYFINLFELPAIVTDYFSIPRFVGNHTDSVFLSFDSSLPGKLLENLIHVIKMLTIGTTDEAINYVPGYFTFYHFTFPISFLGLYLAFRDMFKGGRKKAYSKHSPMVCMFTAAFLFSFMIDPNINRMIFLFLPLVYFFVLGADAIRKYSVYLCGVVLILLSLGAASFTKDYFTEFNQTTSYLCMKGYGKAIQYAESIRKDGQMIYSTYEGLASPFISALYFSETPPQDFVDTVVYKDPNGEFLVASSFTHYVFGLPEDILEEKYHDSIIIISMGEKENFAFDHYKITEFDYYAVVEYMEESQ